MSARKEWHPEKVRSGLTHPVIDGDGHWIEYGPVFAEKVRKAAGDKAADGLLRHMRRIPDVLSLSIAERRRRGIAMEGYWGRQSTNTRDRATAMMPRMLYDRLDELGIDFGIIYPTAGLGIARIEDDETRRAVIRGFNIVTADYFRDLSDRLTPAAVIPMHTPEEAIEELEFVTKQLGSKVGMFGSGIRRPLPGAKGVDPEIARFAAHFDQLGLDSDYDYDPVWQKCRELKIAPTFHTGGRGLGLRNTASNFTFNHIGHFAAAGHAVAKAIFLGGVTRRFPDLRFGFLEGGVRLGLPTVRRPDRALGAARQGRARIHGPEKARPPVAGAAGREIRVQGHRRRTAPPRRLAKPGGRRARRRGPGARRLRRLPDHPQGGLDRPLCEAVLLRLRAGRPDERRRVQQAQPVRRPDQRDLQLRCRPFRHPRHAHGPAGSLGIGRGRADHPDDFRDFTFANAVRLFGTQNPDFFEGTPVADAAAEVLGKTPVRAAAE